MTSVKFGLVGLGRISDRHIKAIQALSPKAVLAAICDIDPEKLKRTEKITGAKPYSNYQTFLKENSSKLDVISICTPSGLHALQGIQGAQKGFHIITEKPMATSLKDGLALNDVCKQMKVKLFVVKQNRFNPPLRALRSAIDSGKLGRIYMLVANVFWTRPQAYYDQDQWRGTWSLDGGAFMNQASHYVDVMRWIGGPVSHVFSEHGTLARNIEAEDTGVSVLKFQSGAIGSINVTMLTHPNNFEGSITVIAENGTIKIGGIALNELIYSSIEDITQAALKGYVGNHESTCVYGTGHLSFYENVLNSIQYDEKIEVDGDEGLTSLELLDGLYQSARTLSVYKLPEHDLVLPTFENIARKGNLGANNFEL
jgi:UDP-N-acetyl-2-amino-2-deoxyglucuronate dehydrogenase